MKFSAMTPSTFLKQSDFDENGLIVTISHFKKQNVAPDDKPPENKYVVYFTEFPDKGMVLNPTNLQLMAIACGEDDADNCAGKEVIVFIDPTIIYGGKVTGGLRVRKYSQPQAPQRREPAPAARQPAPAQRGASGFDDIDDGRAPF